MVPTGGKMTGREWKLLCALMLADCTAGIETTLVLTSLARLSTIFANPIGVGWLLTGYLLMSAAAAALAPALGDALGRKRMLLAVLGLCFIGSTISAFVPGLDWVIAGRVMQGASGALLPLCIGLAREQMEPPNVNFSIGMLAGVASLSSALGYLLAGWLIDNFPWQYLFIVGGGVALCAALAVGAAVGPSPAKQSAHSVDLLGGLLFAPAIALILLGISKGRDWGWLSPAFGSVIFVAVLMLLVWLRREMTHARPLIDIRLLARPKLMAANACIFVAGLGALQPQLVLALLQQPMSSGVGFGLSAVVAGSVLSTGQFCGAIASVLCGRSASRVQGTTLLFWATLLLLGGWACMTAGRSVLPLIVMGYIVMSIGIGVLMSAVAIVVVGAVPPERTSESNGLTTVSRSVGTAIGAQALFAIFAVHTGPARHISATGYDWAFAQVLFFCLLNLLLGFVVIRMGGTRAIAH